MQNTLELVEFLSLAERTCCSCGGAFRSEKRENKCISCRKPKRRSAVAQPLTPRERQVINLVKQAKLNKEIAWELKLSEGTVKEYLNKIFRKLGVHNRTELAIWAMLRDRQAA